MNANTFDVIQVPNVRITILKDIVVLEHVIAIAAIMQIILTARNAPKPDYTWVWILIAIVIVLKISFIIFYVRRRRRHLAILTTSQQPVGNTGYGSTSYQSNQFPAGYSQNFNNPPPPPYSIR
jgi:cytochrome bd-type quinol oxidase subunit 2